MEQSESTASDRTELSAEDVYSTLRVNGNLLMHDAYDKRIITEAIENYAKKYTSQKNAQIQDLIVKLKFSEDKLSYAERIYGKEKLKYEQQIQALKDERTNLITEIVHLNEAGNKMAEALNNITLEVDNQKSNP